MHSQPRTRFVPVVALALALQGCIGTMSSSAPYYPDDWPALDIREGCPELSGTYHAVSEAAAPLDYSYLGRPRTVFTLVLVPVPVGPEVDAPALGRRLLPWHLAGASETSPELPLYPAGSPAGLWAGLEQYTEALGVDLDASGDESGADWVRIRAASEGRLAVTAGRAEAVLLAFASPQPADCKDGALEIGGGFRSPPIEGAETVYASHHFYPAVDGSLVMLESQSWAERNGRTLSFDKWWRWRRIE